MTKEKGEFSGACHDEQTRFRGPVYTKEDLFLNGGEALSQVGATVQKIDIHGRYLWVVDHNPHYPSDKKPTPTRRGQIEQEIMTGLEELGYKNGNDEIDWEGFGKARDLIYGWSPQNLQRPQTSNQ